MLRLLSFISNASRGIIVLAVFAGLLSGLSKAAILALLNTLLHARNPASALRWFLPFVALCLITPVAQFVAQALLAYLGQQSIFNVRTRLSRQILSTPLRRLEEMGGARLMAVITEDIAAISNTVASVPILCMQFAVVAGSMAYMIWLSAKTFLVVVGFILVGATIYQGAMGRAIGFLKDSREHQDALMKHFRTMIEGAKELKLHAPRRRAFLSGVFRPTAEAVQQTNLRGNLIFAGSVSFGYQLVFFVLLGLLLFIMPFFVRSDAQTLTGFTLVLFYMLIPLGDILMLFPTLARAQIALNKIERLGIALASSGADVEASATPPPHEARPLKTLELVGVTHSYHRELENRSFTLGPLNLTFRPGELVFLVGGNGSGKTTLAKLLCGLYTPESGEIRLNGETVTEQTADSYRQYFSVVFSDFYLFENLLGIEADGLDEQAAEYVRLLQLQHKVRIEGGAFSTIELSQGQRKRLALLTSLLEDRPFYIFDEWAADQDPIFKQVFYTQFLPELKARGKAVLVISHDDRYYAVADRLIKLDYGRIEYDSDVAYAGDGERKIPLHS
ncbi:MAG TPA: cyclic peptide export ABC transporter [Pyrinomonadaceae bacterium]|nr:cyclic peptide export ABC transporter [Pyrinomonadaceae bacterium]